MLHNMPMKLALSLLLRELSKLGERNLTTIFFGLQLEVKAKIEQFSTCQVSFKITQHPCMQSFDTIGDKS